MCKPALHIRPNQFYIRPTHSVRSRAVSIVIACVTRYECTHCAVGLLPKATLPVREFSMKPGLGGCRWPLISGYLDLEIEQ